MSVGEGTTSARSSAALAGMDIEHGYVSADGVRLHYVSAGTGPAVILCHGFPELWYSWRHQLEALSASGYRAIALDMRGHGQSDRPPAIGDYSVLHTVGDVIALMDALEIPEAVIGGHDAGTTAAYAATLFRPDRFRGVIGLSVPFVPRGPVSLSTFIEEQTPPGFYWKYFQPPGQAEAELDTNTEQFLRRLFYANSGDLPGGESIFMVVPDNGTLTEVLPEPDGPLSFMPEDQLRHYVEAYRSTGFGSALNGYRVSHQNWVLTAPWAGKALSVPALFVGGDRDTVMRVAGMREAALAMADWHPDSEALSIEGVGHWVQMESPDRVNDAIVAFLGRIGHSAQ